MKRRTAKVLLIGLTAGLLVGMVSAFAEAETKTQIRRGQVKGRFLDPGDVRAAYYYPDGRPAVAVWKNNWYYWWKNNPYTTISIYCASSRGGPWYWMYTASLGPDSKQIPLWITSRRAAYMFVVKNYRNGDIVYLGVR